MPTVDPSEIGTYRRLFDNKFGEIEELLADLPLGQSRVMRKGAEERKRDSRHPNQRVNGDS